MSDEIYITQCAYCDNVCGISTTDYIDTRLQMVRPGWVVKALPRAEAFARFDSKSPFVPCECHERNWEQDRRDALRFRALEAELSNKGHLLSTMLASLDYKYDCPETLAELADKLIEAKRLSENEQSK